MFIIYDDISNNDNDGNVHQKLNGTESQRTPFSKLRSILYRYSGFFRGPFRNGPGQDISWISTWNPKQPFINGCWVKQPFSM